MNKWNVCRTVSVLILGALPLSARAAAQSVDLDQGLNIRPWPGARERQERRAYPLEGSGSGESQGVLS